MNWNHQKRCTLITGKSGSGKTSLYLATLKAWPARWQFVFDPDREVARKLNWPVCLSVAAMNFAVARRTPICFDPSSMFRGDMPGAFAFFCRYTLNVARCLKGTKLLCADEIQKFTRAGQGGVPPAFQELLDVGRREEIDCLLIAQKPNEVNASIRAQLSEIITFRHTDRLPLDALESDGFDRNAVAGLEYPGACIARDLNREESTTITPGAGSDTQRKTNRDPVAIGPKTRRHGRGSASPHSDDRFPPRKSPAKVAGI